MAKKPKRSSQADEYAEWRTFACFAVGANGETHDYPSVDAAADDLDLNPDDIVNAMLTGGSVNGLEFGWVL